MAKSKEEEVKPVVKDDLFKKEETKDTSTKKVETPHTFATHKETYSLPTIKAISGKKVTTCCGDEEECCWIATDAEVTLNGEKTTLAALNNSDTVELGNYKKVEPNAGGEMRYHKVTATRKV